MKVNEVKMYRRGDSWFFDDEKLGIEHRKLIYEIDQMLFKNRMKPKNKVTVYFSDEDFDNAKELMYSYSNGNCYTFQCKDDIYTIDNTLHCYFKQIPKMLYFDIE